MHQHQIDLILIISMAFLMDKIEIIALAVALPIVAYRIYQKYIKKGRGPQGSETKEPGSSFRISSSTDDDYEPYSGK